MRLIIADQLTLDWAASKIPHLFGLPFEGGKGFGIINREGLLVGAVIFNGWNPGARTIDISFVADDPRCLTKTLVQAIFAYPFDQLQVQRVSAITPKRHRPARRFLEKFGFKREGLARRGFGAHGDGMLYGLLEHEWRASRFHPRGEIDGKGQGPDARRSHCDRSGANPVQH